MRESIFAIKDKTSIDLIASKGKNVSKGRATIKIELSKEGNDEESRGRGPNIIRRKGQGT